MLSELPAFSELMQQLHTSLAQLGPQDANVSVRDDISFGLHVAEGAVVVPPFPAPLLAPGSPAQGVKPGVSGVHCRSWE